MRDEQVRRYSRHIRLPDIGGLGQTALLVATAKLPLRESEPLAELIAGSYLAAGGVGTLVVPNATDAQRAELAAHGPDSNIVTEGGGREVVLAQRPAWWPSAAGDEVALAFWRGSIAATAWMADAATR
ncbi:MAG: Dinucleotide-utilizing protein involved in molybdopterin and thiamine biosynthesis family 2-like [Myxococcales bacterium]|nr:Dinucleotide-utilizing protein involved in molybdopterin and thiamine biosynthesis family 2-like [Myxococcales bacterium]